MKPVRVKIIPNTRNFLLAGLSIQSIRYAKPGIKNKDGSKSDGPQNIRKLLST